MMAWETSNINLAAYIKHAKNIDTCGHRFNGRQLCIEFEITEDEANQYAKEYINSTYAGYDSTKRNFTQLLKLAPK